MTGRWAKEVLESGMSRRSFLKAAGTVAAVAVSGCVGANSPVLPTPSPSPTLASSLTPSASPSAAPAANTLVVATDADPAKLVDRALDAFGSLPIKGGDTVVIKVNFSWARTVDQAANNHPQVLARLMGRCREAGASEVIAFDHAIDTARLCLERSGIKAAVEKAGFTAVDAGDIGDYEERQFSGPALSSARIAKILKRADVFIDAPVVKSHGTTQLTASMKNLMGVIWDRGAFHRGDLDGCIADLAGALRPTLVVADAYRVLKTGGPNGGNPGDIIHPHQLIVGRDPVAVDAFAATLLGLEGRDIGHILKAYERGVGEIDLGKVAIQRVV